MKDIIASKAFVFELRKTKACCDDDCCGLVEIARSGLVGGGYVGHITSGQVWGMSEK
jgi:hypothetical protein